MNVKEQAPEDQFHFICFGIDNQSGAYELDFILDERENIQGTWRGANKFAFQGQGLKLHEGEYVFYFSSQNKDEPIEGIQHYKVSDNDYLFGTWTAWTQNDLDNKVRSRLYGKETCLRVS